MQAFVNLFSFSIVINALFLQGILIFIIRQVRNTYLNAVMRFQRPKSSLARYYAWRTSGLRNMVIEAIVFEIVLISSILLIVYPRGGLDLLILLLPITVFVIILSSISSIQMIWRIREVLKKEKLVLRKLNGAEDKIGIAHQMVEELYQAGAYADGQIWFVMFKIALQQDPVGWSVRDVLMEKSKKIAERLETHMRDATSIQDSEDGPDIR